MERESGYIPEEATKDTAVSHEGGEQEDESELRDVELAEYILDDVAELKTRFSSEELAARIKRIQEGDVVAEQEILNQFEPVMRRILLRKIQPEDKQLNQEMIEDLEQEGRVGLLEYAHQTKHAQGALSTGAYVAILGAMMKYLYTNQGAMSLPIATDKLLRDAEEGKYKPEEMSGRPARRGDELSISPGWLTIIRYILDPLSVDEPGERQLVEQQLEGDSVNEYGVPELKEVVERETVHKAIHSALEGAPEQWRIAMRWRFGFEDGSPHTLREIGDIMHMSHEPIRQYEIKTLKRLRRILRDQKDWLM